MKRKNLLTGSVLLILCLLLYLPAVPALAEDASRSYLFSVTGNGSHEIMAEQGDVITVEYTLKRTDSEEDYVMWGMQNEMCYDASMLELVDGSGIALSGVETADIAVEDNYREYYMNYVSLSGGTNWKTETTVGTFKLRVLAETGTAFVSCRDYLVSTSDGADCYSAECENLQITIGKGVSGANGLPNRLMPAKTGRSVYYYSAGAVLLLVLWIVLIIAARKPVVFCPENGEKKTTVHVRRGKPAAAPKPPKKPGYRFTGWYRNPDGTEKWDFACDTVEEKTQLYAGWEII